MKENIKKYSILQRIKYAGSRNYFLTDFNNKPLIPTDMDIHIDLIWRELQQNKRRKLFYSQKR